ncbi:MAG: hypothetical protein Q4F53_04155 [Nesterenkonia sp.]|uniref:hypothetical protein n=1 Tax=Nesterenkonia marinintestina TaxID=2979865 RepID=UPI0021C0D719|nr:hypothetical protein [Nesterenkonia sp. GX14115]MDO5492790.1 hypothetical protein [Nesterenkonia sp.]
MRAVVVRFGLLPAVLVPIWFSGARVLTDSAGQLSVVLALTAAPAMIVVYLLTLHLPGRRRRHDTGEPVRPSTRALALLTASWVFGAIFGASVPDLGPGAASVVTVLAGDGARGASAALSNPAGILMLFSAAAALGTAVFDARREESGPPAPIEHETVLHAYGYGFMDEPAESSEPSEEPGR